jgi:ssRNA-specific RNase YbeY (16S rRNA maturation enzyme)
MNSKQQVTDQVFADLQATEKAQLNNIYADNSDQDELNNSFHSARSTTETLAMRLDAAPFDPKAIF